ncbi:MAG: HEAT repeat domain-containing protein [Caldilineaceae bacterium]
MAILFRALQSVDPELRGNAAKAIAQLDPEGGVQRLEVRLKPNRERDAWALRRTIEALSKVGTPATIPLLEPYLRDEKARNRQRARETIAAIEQRYDLT